MSLDRLTTRGAWTPPYLISPPNERGHGEPILPALDDVALRALLPEAELGAAVVGGDAAARGHAVLAGQHGDRVAQADVPVSKESPLATAVFVKSGERPEWNYCMMIDYGSILKLNI